MTASPSLASLAGSCAAAAALFLLLFRGQGLGGLDFWWSMAALNIAACTAAACLDRTFLPRIRDDVKSHLRKKLLLGAATACLLYVIFIVGNELAPLIIPGASQRIHEIYGFKGDTPLWRVVVLIAAVIGPGEEFFWRGYVQHNIARTAGALRGMLAATAIYGLVHLSSGNVMLVLAALVCGAFWGAAYLWRRSIVINVVSHTLWDLVVFIVLPIR